MKTERFESMTNIDILLKVQKELSIDHNIKYKKRKTGGKGAAKGGGAERCPPIRATLPHLRPQANGTGHRGGSTVAGVVRARAGRIRAAIGAPARAGATGGAHAHEPAAEAGNGGRGGHQNRGDGPVRVRATLLA